MGKNKGNTATADAQKKGNKQTPAAPTAAKGNAAPATPQGNTESKEWKNFTKVNIDPSVDGSCQAWLSEFTAKSDAEPPTKGYDQHWNKFGFIHAGPAKRLTNQGAARMMVFLENALAERANGGDKEAGAILNFCLKFGKDRPATLKAESHSAAIENAKKLLEESGAKVVQS